MPDKKPETGKSLEVASRLEQQILRSGLRPGWRLPSEEQLCRSHSVSRTVVREAIQQLKARGLVTSRRGGGTYVAALDEEVVGRAMLAFAALAESPAAFDNLLDLRAQLEGACVRELTRRKDKDCVARLKARIDALRRVRDLPEAFADADADLHRQFSEESSNHLYRTLLRSVAEAIAAPARRALETAERRDRVLADHDAIYEAVRTGNAEAAAALTLAHAQRDKPEIAESRAALRR